MRQPSLLDLGLLVLSGSEVLGSIHGKCLIRENSWCLLITGLGAGVCGIGERNSDFSD